MINPAGSLPKKSNLSAVLVSSPVKEESLPRDSKADLTDLKTVASSSTRVPAAGQNPLHHPRSQIGKLMAQHCETKPQIAASAARKYAKQTQVRGAFQAHLAAQKDAKTKDVILPPETIKSIRRGL